MKLYCKSPCQSLIPDLFEELEQLTLLEVGTLRAIAAANTFCGRPWGPPTIGPKTVRNEPFYIKELERN